VAQREKLLRGAVSGNAEVHRFDALARLERADLQPLGKQPPERLLELDLKRLGVGVAEHCDAVNARRFRHGVLAVAQAAAVDLHVGVAFRAAPAFDARAQARAGHLVRQPEARVGEPDGAQRKFAEREKDEHAAHDEREIHREALHSGEVSAASARRFRAAGGPNGLTGRSRR
jgi:hypothetical protein